MASNRKVLIFGKTGDGKSTVGNMLVHGSLYPPRGGHLAFQVGDGLEGVTEKVEQASGGGYDVVDTVGLGEQTESERKRAVDLIYNFLVKTKGMRAYNHIIFVKEAGRYDQLDEDIWEVFLNVFRGCEPQFVLVLTKAKKDPAQWMQENGRQIAEKYPQCEGRTVCVTFPPVESDARVEAIYQNRRMMSLRELTSKLHQFSTSNRVGVFPLQYADMNKQQLERKSTSIWTTITKLASYLNPRNALRAFFGRNTRYIKEY
ncbi:hypothetical protein M758_1G003600 [Ceratodon purpureus]|nr:hypothetical protein M758_1G003600 [Ceratodon purpureus]